MSWLIAAAAASAGCAPAALTGLAILRHARARLQPRRCWLPGGLTLVAWALWCWLAHIAPRPWMGAAAPVAAWAVCALFALWHWLGPVMTFG